MKKEVITLKNIKNFSNQQIFDQLVKHLSNTTKYSRLLRHFSVNTIHKSFIGSLIPDNVYHERLECMNIRKLFNYFNLEEGVDYNLNFINVCFMLTETGFPEGWFNGLSNIAEQFNFDNSSLLDSKWKIKQLNVPYDYKHYILSRILFKYDPANTCCVENESFDEYDEITKEWLKNERTLEELFDYYFDKNYDVELVNKVKQQILKVNIFE